MKKIHICILTTAHPIDDVRVNHKFASAFYDAGFKVTWVGPGHAFFDANIKNSKDIEFKLGPAIRSRMDRVLSQFRIRSIAAQVSDVDAYYAPEPDSAELALSFAKKSGAKVIFDIHEVYHGAMLDRWLMGLRLPRVREYFKRRVARIALKCDLVIGVSDSVLLPYVTGDTPHVVVRSCAPSWFATGEPADVCDPMRDRFRVMHGKSDVGRGALQVVEAAAIVKADVQGVSFVMFENASSGSGEEPDRVTARIDELDVGDAVELMPGVPMQEMPNILKACDVGLIAYGRSLGVDSLPNRLFEYMAAGLAVIAPSYSTEIAKIIGAEECGMLVDFEDPAQIANAVIFLKRNPERCREMGRRARTAFLKRHNWETEVLPVIDRIKHWVA